MKRGDPYCGCQWGVGGGGEKGEEGCYWTVTMPLIVSSETNASSRGWIKGITLTTWTIGADITHAHITALTTPSTHPTVLRD